MNKFSAFLETYGSAKLAGELGVSRAAVSHWRHKRFRVPAERCLEIEAISEGFITRYDLRPDVFGPIPVAPEGERRTASTDRRKTGLRTDVDGVDAAESSERAA